MQSKKDQEWLDNEDIESLKEESKHLDKICPNCGSNFNGIECEECDFDAYCFDPNWD